MSPIFAHAGEDHGDALESAQHAFEVDTLIFVPAALLLMAIIPLLLRRFFPKSSAPFFVLMLELFIVGTLSYTAVPILSIICIGGGFVLSLAFAFGGLIGK